MAYNSIGDNGAKAIAAALKVNAVVTILDLGHNSIGDEGAIAIEEALKVTAVLTKLWLGSNNMGDAGWKTSGAKRSQGPEWISVASVDSASTVNMCVRSPHRHTFTHRHIPIRTPNHHVAGTLVPNRTWAGGF